MYNGSTLGTAWLPSTRLRGAWRKLTLRHTVNGLTVLLDTDVLFDNLRLPGFQPTVRWRLAIGARCGSRNDFHLIDDVHIYQGDSLRPPPLAQFPDLDEPTSAFHWNFAGASLGQGHAVVEFTPNGRDYSEGHLLFEYYPFTVVTSVHPPCGPTDGGTVVTLRGDNLRRLGNFARGEARDSGYKCGWGEVIRRYWRLV